MNERIAAFSFGVVFVIVMLAIAIWIPHPTVTQWFIFRVVLALAAGGVGALIPGLIRVQAGPYVRAGGALALFVLVFWFNPPKLVATPPQQGGEKGELVIPSLGKPLKVFASVVASGSSLEKKTVWHPLGRMGTDKGPASFYIDSEAGNVNSHTLVCPAAESGYEIDSDPTPGFSYGMTDLQHVKKGGDKYWDVSQADKGCIQLYCDGRNGSSHVWISEVQVRERRVNPVTQCHTPLHQDSTILPGELKDISLDLQQAASGCENPQWQSHIEIRDVNGAKLSEKDLAPGAPPELALDGWVIFSLNSKGVLEVQYRKRSDAAE